MKNEDAGLAAAEIAAKAEQIEHLALTLRDHNLREVDRCLEMGGVTGVELARGQLRTCHMLLGLLADLGSDALAIVDEEA